MTLLDVAETDQSKELDLRAGPNWRSFEQFRIERPADIRDQLHPDSIGRLSIKNDEFVIMHAATFNMIYGLARAASWLSGNLVLVRQAAQLVHKTSTNEVAVQHLRDLVFRLADVVGQPQEKQHPLRFDSGESAGDSDSSGEFELDPGRLRRSTRAESR